MSISRKCIHGAAALILLMAFPLLANAASGKELVAIFQTHCLEPFPSVEKIAAAALRSGYEEHLLEVEDVFGIDGLHPILEAYVASIVNLDARAFAAPVGDVRKPTITAIGIKRTVAGAGQTIESACVLSAEKANEGVAGLDAWIAGIARVLKEKYGFPFKWERKVKSETDELSSGQIKWTPVGFPGIGEERFGVLAILKFVEAEPRYGIHDSSTWFLSIEFRMARP